MWIAGFTLSIVLFSLSTSVHCCTEGESSQGSSTSINKCSRKCTTKPDGSVKCCRVRKDFTSMTECERRRFVAAFKHISTSSRYVAKYNNLVKLHVDKFRTSIHQLSEFLPWHRWYLVQLENLLLAVDCRVTLPYWDWSLFAHDPWKTAGNGIWASDGTGLGGTGTAPNYCVKTGPFRQGAWKVAPAARGGKGSCLRRNFTGTPPDAAAVAVVMSLAPEQFIEFESAVRVNLHDRVHCLMSTSAGHMCTRLASGAPEFFIHHAFIDKIWYDWQAKSPAHKNVYFMESNARLTKFPHRTSSFVDSAAMPDETCVEYAAPTHDRANLIVNSLRGLKRETLESVPRRNISAFPNSAVKMFHLSKLTLTHMVSAEKEILPHNIIHAKGLAKEEQVLGFRVPREVLTAGDASDESWRELADEVHQENVGDDDEEDDDEEDEEEEDDEEEDEEDEEQQEEDDGDVDDEGRD